MPSYRTAPGVYYLPRNTAKDSTSAPGSRLVKVQVAKDTSTGLLGTVCTCSPGVYNSDCLHSVEVIKRLLANPDEIELLDE